MRAILLCVLGILGVAVPPQDPPTESRAALIAALERLMITGEPHDTSLDDGQLLQLSVDDAIRNGDIEVERAAIRAAAPLFATVDRPLIEVGQPVSVGVSARPILKLPRAVAFKAVIHVSVDGRDYVEAGTLTSAKESHVTAAALLDTPREFWPTADLAIAPTDITIETPRPDWAIITVTVHNNGAVAVYRARVTVSAGIDPESRAIPSRNLTVDVPGNGSSEIRLGTRLPGPYGFVFAHATQISDMSPHDTFTFDPTPEDACAFRLINARLAPAEYLPTIARLSGPCAGW
jgi:hypothetical protein